MRPFAALTILLSLACAGAPEEESSRRRGGGGSDDEDTAGTDTADTSTGDTGTTDTGRDSGTDTGRDTGGGDTGNANADSDRDGWTVAEGDCDDLDRGTNPGATEDCNGYDDDCDGATDEGCGGGGSTETYELAWAGAFRATSSSYTSGSFGVAFLDGAGREACRLAGSMTRQGAAPTGCPQCDWSFNLSAPGTLSGTGTACADIAAAGYDATWASSDLGIGSSDWSWGFSDVYTYNGETIATNVVWIFDGSDWRSWGYEAGTDTASYPGTADFRVDGTSSNFTWSKQAGAYYDVYVAP